MQDREDLHDDAPALGWVAERRNLVVAAIALVLVGIALGVVLWPDDSNDGNTADRFEDDRGDLASAGFDVDLTVEIIPPKDAAKVDAMLDELRSVNGVEAAAYLEPAIVQGIVPDGETLTMDAAVQVSFDGSLGDADDTVQLEDQLTDVIRRHTSLPG